jgi:hypothetical protein
VTSEMLFRSCIVIQPVWEAVEQEINGLGKSTYIHILIVESTTHETPTTEKQVGAQSSFSGGKKTTVEQLHA